MIIKDKIKALRKGYPTVSDKYNVAGGIVDAGANDLVIGELVQYTDTPGKYKPAVNVNAIGDIAGIALAVNARLNPVWPNDGKTELKVKAGEAFDLFVDGWIAVQLDDGVVTEDKPAMAPVAFLTQDEDIDGEKDYYTRSENEGEVGELHDGTYKYTLVASPVQGNLETYYELPFIGSDAEVNEVTPGKQAAVILATGKITVADNAATGIVLWPGAFFTGFTEGRLAELELRRI